MPELLIAFGLLAFLGISYYKREWGIYTIILGLPTYQIRFQISGIPMTFLEGMILTLAALEIFTILRNKKKLADLGPLSLNITILVFLIASGLSIITGPDTIKAAGIFKAYFFEAVLFYFIVRLVIDSPVKRETLQQILAILVLYLSVFGIFQYLTLWNLPPSWWDVNFAERRIVSLLNHPNGLALLIGPILAFLAMAERKNKLMWAAIILGLPAFYMTFSRAGWLALAATIMVFGFLKLRGASRLARDWKKLAGIMLGIIILVLMIPISRTKLVSLTHADPSKQNRYVLWSAAADMLKHHPIAGMGLMGFREAYKNYPLGPDRVIQNYPHNFFLTFWVETGLFGLLSIITLLILFAKKIRSLLRTEFRTYALACGAAMTMIVLHSLVDVSYFKNDLAVLFWLVFALPFLTLRFD